MSAGLTPVLEDHSVCRFNSSPGGPQCLQVNLQLQSADLGTLLSI